MIMVCPLPIIWDKIYRCLLNKWQEDGVKGEQPPVPLILSGWVFSSDVQKKKVWNRTIDWAEKHGYSNVVTGIKDEDFYWVDNLSNEEGGYL